MFGHILLIAVYLCMHNIVS